MAAAVEPWCGRRCCCAALANEIRVAIGGRHGIVVHAHCKADGTPKSGNACHFKRANNKRESGGTFPLWGALRGALLPGKDAILAERSDVWEGRRPDYV